MTGGIWNYSFTVPCALLMATLLAFYFSRRRLPIRINIAFLVLLAHQLLVMAFDIGSSIADEHFREISPEMLYLLNTCYFAFYIGRSICFFGFTAEVVHARTNWLMRLAVVPFLVGEALCISSFATGAVFWIDNGYHSGPFYNILYVCSYFYIAASFILLVMKAKQLNKFDIASIIAFNAVLLVGNIVRYLFPFLLAMNTFCMVAIVIIYLSFMNPDNYLASSHIVFNLHGFRALIRDWEGNRDYQVLGFALRNYNYERSIVGGRRMDTVVTSISEYLRSAFPDMLPFYLRRGRFALIMPPSANWEEIQQTIAKRFEEPWQVNNTTLPLAIAFVHADSQTTSGDSSRLSENLIVALDEAVTMQMVDEGTAEDTPEIITITDQRVEVMRLLENAIYEDHVEMFLQPLYRSDTGTMIAAEALARIRDAEGRIVSPAQFIPIAENSGYIVPLGDQILRGVCSFICSYDIDAMGLRWINVNLSPVQCMQHDITERVMTILEHYKVDPSRIHFEITEESMIDYTLLERQIKALRKLGFQFALDDYGSGYSNLTRVKHYPFVSIKIDREVIWDYCKEQDSLLPGIVQSFRQMGLSVTAEGIETPEMANCATSIGCDCLQGYLYSEPLPVDEFVRKFG